MTRLTYIAAALFAVPACGDDPVSYSAPVGINLKAKSDDVVNSVVDDEKGINTESGNPYGAFVSDARRELGGREPGRISVDKVELFLGASSTGVTRLGEVFTGNVEVLFVMNDTNNSFPVADANVAADATAGPLALGVDFNSDDVQGDDYAKLTGGNFKVVIRGPAAAGFNGKGADADLQTTFTFSAFE